MAKLDMNPRTCIVTREEGSPDQLIRFVLGPEGKVYPDLKRKLPGRGVWVSCERSRVEEAVQKGAFARGLKTKVVADISLPQQVEALMKADALGLLALAKKAGEIVPGQANAEAAVKSGAAALVLTATDASEGGVGKMERALHALEQFEDITVPAFRMFSSDELDQATGGVNTMHLALLSGGIADKLIKAVGRLIRYRGESLQKAK